MTIFTQITIFWLQIRRSSDENEIKNNFLKLLRKIDNEIYLCERFLKTRDLRSTP